MESPSKNEKKSKIKPLYVRELTLLDVHRISVKKVPSPNLLKPFETNSFLDLYKD